MIGLVALEVGGPNGQQLGSERWAAALSLTPKRQSANAEPEAVQSSQIWPPGIRQEKRQQGLRDAT
jgi:hypothetical protein